MKNFFALFILFFISCVSEPPKKVQVAFKAFHSAEAMNVNNKENLEKALKKRNWDILEEIEISKGGSDFIKVKIKKENSPYILIYENKGNLVEKKLSIETKKEAIDMMLVFYANSDLFKLKYETF